VLTTPIRHLTWTSLSLGASLTPPAPHSPSPLSPSRPSRVKQSRLLACPPSDGRHHSPHDLSHPSPSPSLRSQSSSPSLHALTLAHLSLNFHAQSSTQVGHIYIRHLPFPSSLPCPPTPTSHLRLSLVTEGTPKGSRQPTRRQGPNRTRALSTGLATGQGNATDRLGIALHFGLQAASCIPGAA
jgi:hypothetical protein